MGWAPRPDRRKGIDDKQIDPGQRWIVTKDFPGGDCLCVELDAVLEIPPRRRPQRLASSGENARQDITSKALRREEWCVHGRLLQWRRRAVILRERKPGGYQDGSLYPSIKFHWHVEDKGVRHAYIKPASPQLNGKVERSHRSDQEEFYQLLTYKDDVDLEAKLREWERFYNLARPHGAFKGKTPYEALKERLS
jgi:hypothetical protein